MKIKKVGDIHDTQTGFDFRTDKKLTLKQAIKYKCLECMNGSLHYVKTCEAYDCPLWPLREGADLTK